jgi:hypothetical protein
MVDTCTSALESPDYNNKPNQRLGALALEEEIMLPHGPVDLTKWPGGWLDPAR